MATGAETEQGSNPLAQGDWRVVGADSEIGFETRAMLGLLPVRGRFGGLEGELHVDGDGRASGTLLVDAATVSTGIGLRDAHLRTKDFFAVKEHPRVSFELDELTREDDGSLHLTGALHVREHAIPVATAVSVAEVGGDRLRMDADFPLEHRASELRSSGSGWKKVAEILRVKAAVVLERSS
jgi:polyisoprenoid-binding protein YceI